MLQLRFQITFTFEFGFLAFLKRYPRLCLCVNLSFILFLLHILADRFLFVLYDLVHIFKHVFIIKFRFHFDRVAFFNGRVLSLHLFSFSFSVDSQDGTYAMHSAKCALWLHFFCSLSAPTIIFLYLLKSVWVEWLNFAFC